MKGSNFKQGNSLIFDVPAPIDRVDRSDPLAIDGADFDVYVFDRGVKSEVATFAASGAATLTLTDVSDFSALMDVEISQNDFTRRAVTILSIDAALNTITFTPNTNGDCFVGRRVIRKIGATITGAQYGTASITDTLWGYSAEIPYDHSALLDEVQELQVEGVLDDGVTGAHWEEAWSVIVSEAWGDS